MDTQEETFEHEDASALTDITEDAWDEVPQDAEGEGATNTALATLEEQDDALKGLVSENAISNHGHMVIDPREIVLGNAGEPPSKDLIDSINTVGIIKPPVVMVVGDQAVIVDGRRRVRAAIQLGLGKITVNVESRPDANARVLSLAANVHRSRNMIGEFQDIKALMDEGFTIKQVAKATGLLESQIIASIDAGTRLDPRLMKGVEEGKIQRAAAQNAARMPQPVQERLARQLEEKGRITKADTIRERRHLQEKAAVGQFSALHQRDLPELAPPDETEQDDDYVGEPDLVIHVSPEPEPATQDAKLSVREMRWASAIKDITAARGTLLGIKSNQRKQDEQEALDFLQEALNRLKDLQAGKESA